MRIFLRFLFLLVVLSAGISVILAIDNPTPISVTGEDGIERIGYFLSMPDNPVSQPDDATIEILSPAGFNAQPQIDVLNSTVTQIRIDTGTLAAANSGFNIFRSTAQVKIDALGVSTTSLLSFIQSTAALSSFQFAAAFSSISTLQIATATLSAQTTYNILNPSNTNYIFNQNRSVQIATFSVNLAKAQLAVIGNGSLPAGSTILKVSSINADLNFGWSPDVATHFISAFSTSWPGNYQDLSISANSVKFNTGNFSGNVANAVITNPGNVGIGTLSPTSKVHVFNGDLAVSGLSNQDILLNGRSLSNQFTAAFSSITTLQAATATLSYQISFSTLNPSNTNYINTSVVTQTKIGGLNVNGFVQTGSATVTGDFLVRNILIANKRPAITQNAGTGSTSSGEYINGWQFIVSSNDIYVTDLGYYASSLTSGSRPVAIFTAAGVLVSSTDVQSTDSSDGLYKLRAITPVKLSAGNEYAILTAVPVNEARLQGVYTGFGVTNSVNVVSTKTYVSTPYNAPLTLPGSEDVSGVIFPQAGFNFTFSSTLLSVSTAGVGIGTASPAQSFHVHSATFVVTSTGRIGLGTTNPTVTLHLIGSGDQSSNQENRLLWLGSTANYSDLEVQANAGNGPSFGAIANGLTSDPYVSMTQTSNHPMYLGGSTGSNPGIVVSTHTPRRIGIGLDANSINSGSQFQIGAASFTVTTSGNVGIGFSTPTQRLQIVDQTTNGSQINLQSFRGSSGSNSMITLDKYRGTIAAPASVTNGDADGEVRFRAYDGTTLLPTAAILSSVDDIVSTNKMPGNFSVRINSGTTTTIERLKINSLGNVGLGTTDPAARLHVNQTAGAGIAIVGSSDGGANDDTLQFRSSYSGLLNSSDITGSIVGAPSNDGGRLIFRTSQNGTGTLTERMRVTDFGNVGIGTANPPQKLSVTGGTIQSALDGVWFKGRDGSDTIDMFTVERTNNGAEIKTWSGGTSPLLLNPNGNVGIGTMNPSNKFQVIAAGDHAVWGQTNSSSFWGAVFYNSSNSNEVDLAGPHAGIFKVGNVGIGTNNPGKKLTVDGNMEVGINSADYHHLRIGGGNSSGYAYGAFAKYGDGIHLGYNFYNDNASNVIDNSGGSTSRLSLSYGSIAMYTGTINTEPTNLGYYQNSAGNVGIGTNSPIAKLEVNGNIRQSWTATSTTLRTEYYGDGGNKYYGGLAYETGNRIQYLQSVTQDGVGGIRFQTGSTNNDRMTIDNSGNVGIGTTAPTAALYVNGGTVAPNLTNGSASGFILRGDVFAELAMAFGYPTYPGMYLQSRYNDGVLPLLLNPLGGNVGIGTAVPTQKLDVAGDAYKSAGGLSWAVTSDKRLKNIKGSFSAGLKEIETIQPVRFSYKADKEKREQIGLIAQEVQKVIPEAVSEDQNGYLSMHADPVIWAMLNSIKELSEKIKKLEAKNK